MDLGAYVQIGDLESLMKANGINIPRLRGLRLMSKEKPFSKEEIETLLKEASLYACEEALCKVPAFSYKAVWVEYSDSTDRRCKKYLEYTSDTNGWKTVKDVRWDKLHGKRRKFLKIHARKAVKKKKQELDMWNKFAGRDDVLYIHAKIGSSNWSSCHWSNFIKEPWFLGAVDDQFDGAYCDIYAKINKHAG